MSEREALLLVCIRMLRPVIDDGGKKRRAGIRPPWWAQDDQEEKLFRHLLAWKSSVREDVDSGAHPLVHAAVRALMIAYQETEGRTPPADDEY